MSSTNTGREIGRVMAADRMDLVGYSWKIMTFSLYMLYSRKPMFPASRPNFYHFLFIQSLVVTRRSIMESAGRLILSLPPAIHPGRFVSRVAELICAV